MASPNKHMSPESGIAEDISSIKTGIEMLSQQQRDATVTFEQYRKDVHTRFTETHNMMNLGNLRISDKLEAESRRTDAVEHDIKNTTLMLREFKEFGKDITTAIGEIKEYIVADKARNGMGAKMVEFVFKLAAFCLAIIGIVTYLKQ